MKSNALQITTGIKRCMNHHLVPMVHGSTGSGKSDIVAQIADEANFKLIDWRGSSADPTDLNGFPKLNEAKATYLPFDTFPVKGDKLPSGYNGWLLFLDELPNAPMSVLKAAYKLILDRMVGNHPLHEKVYVVAAGNLLTEGAQVNDFPAPLKTRMIHFELAIDADLWIKWGSANDVDYRMLSFIGYKPNLLYNPNPASKDFTFSCPRSITMAAALTKGREITFDDMPILAGTISEGVAREYAGYVKNFADLPQIKNILADPLGTKIPTEPSAKWATGSHVAEYLTPDNANTLMQYLERLPLENQTIALRVAIAKNKKLLLNHTIGEWMTKYATRKVG